MNKYSICIVDDKIPAAGKMDDTVRLNSNNLKYLKDKVSDWADSQVREFVERLLNIQGWTLSGFTDPNFLINCIDEELYRPDIVIFDWEYSSTPVGSDGVEQSLMEILQQSFSIVFIFTGADKLDEINAILKKPNFDKFKNRLKVKDKTDKDSTRSLYDEIEKMRKQNFSFKFGVELRKKSLEAVDKILIELGKVELAQAVNYFKLDGDTGKDIIDFIGERFKNHLTTTQFKELHEEVKNLDERDSHLEESAEEGKDDGKPDLEIAKKLWSYRLYFYHSENDTLVRKGDIIEMDNRMFIVVTADCHLTYFWHKNYGYLNLLPIHEIKKGDEYIMKLATLTREEKKVKEKIVFNEKNKFVTSFSNEIKGLPDVLILPFLKYGDKFKDFALFPKELTNTKIEIKEGDNQKSEKEKGKMGLKYDKNFEFTRIATISEPFLTPLIQHIFNSIAGYGTPDYPDNVGKLITENFRKIFA